MNDKLTKFINEISQGSIKYQDPRNVKFKDIDPKLKKAIKYINSSNWCWTLWSCQGHFYDNGSISNPYVTFIVSNKKMDKFLELIFKTLPIYKSYKLPIASSYYFEVHLGHSNKYFSIVSIYWSSNFINSKKDNFNFYSDIKYFGKKIKENK